MFPFFFFQTEATKDSDMSRYIHAPKEEAAARWNEVYTRFLPLTATVWTEEQAAPMEDGALPMLPLYVDLPPAHLDLRRDGLPLSLRRFPGYKAHGFCWVPYGLYDAADTPIPYYNGDMTGLVSGASAYVYTAWYNNVPAGDK